VRLAFATLCPSLQEKTMPVSSTSMKLTRVFGPTGKEPRSADAQRPFKSSASSEQQSGRRPPHVLAFAHAGQLCLSRSRGGMLQLTLGRIEVPLGTMSGCRRSKGKKPGLREERNPSKGAWRHRRGFESGASPGFYFGQALALSSQPFDGQTNLLSPLPLTS
jgi:hypothetical protein